MKKLTQLQLDQQYTEESKLLKVVKEYLDAQSDTLVMRICDRYACGYSDIFLCTRGQFVAIELKDNTGKPTAHQILFLEQVRRAGGIGAVCRTLGEVIQLVEKARYIADGHKRNDSSQ